jgi:hypothetical protein
MDGDRKDTETGDKEEYRKIEFAGRNYILGLFCQNKSVFLLISRKAYEIICINKEGCCKQLCAAAK